MTRTVPWVLLALAGAAPAAAQPPAPAAKVLWTVPNAGQVIGRSPDGEALFTSVVEDGQPLVVVWDTRTGRRVRARPVPVGPDEHEKQFPRDLVAGRYFACEYKETLLSFDLKTGDGWGHPMPGRADARYLRVSPTGECVARFNGYSVTHVIETRTGKVVHQIGEQDPPPGRAFVHGKADGLAFTPDGRFLVYHYRDVGGRFLRVWDAEKRTVTDPRAVLDGPIVTDRFVVVPTAVPGAPPPPPDPRPGDRIPGRFTVFTLPDLRERCVIPWETVGRPGYPATPLAFSPDGRRVAAWPGGDGLQFWDLAAGAKVGAVAVDPQVNAVGEYRSPVIWSPDGMKAAAYSRDGPGLRMIDAARPRELWARPAGPEHVWPYFTTDSRRLAVSTGKAVVYLDAATGAEQLVVPALGRAGGLNLTADGRFLWFADSRPDRARGPDIDGGFPPTITWRVLHRDTGREALRVEAPQPNPFPGYAKFYATGDGRAVILTAFDTREKINLTCWSITGP